jgi:hypothetical protein
MIPFWEGKTMESLLSKLSDLIKAMRMNPEPESGYSVFQCFVELWESGESIIVPTVTDDEGDVYLSTMKPASGKYKNIPLLLTEIDINGRECHRVVSDEEYMVFFTEERFLINHKEITLMYIPFNTLIQHYIENTESFLGIIVNPFHEDYTMQLTSKLIDVLIEVKHTRQTRTT